MCARVAQVQALGGEVEAARVRVAELEAEVAELTKEVRGGVGGVGGAGAGARGGGGQLRSTTLCVRAPGGDRVTQVALRDEMEAALKESLREAERTLKRQVKGESGRST